ncbi:MAG: hypothetical protein ABGZ35_03540 [Planctomycetaceae bacterium]
MPEPLFELLVTFTTTLSRTCLLPSFFPDALKTPATNLVHFENELLAAFAFLRRH